MVHFENDYSCGAHPEILKALANSSMEGNVGYGLDGHTRNASASILAECGIEEGAVFFLVGGTQTNAVALDWLCRCGEGVIATTDAHINVHESGAIESAGHKVITLPSAGGKLSASDIDVYMTDYYTDPTWPHIVRPSAVYLSQPTELGTLYRLHELQGIRQVCSKYDLRLYVDGARLLYALASKSNDVTLKDLAELADAFYIGGTKAGTLFGEALVLPGKVDFHRFFSHIKRHGALLAKGWLAAAQFEALFSGGLYKEIGDSALEIACGVRNVMLDAGCREVIVSVTNQLFFEVRDTLLERLDGEIAVDVQRRLTDRSHLVRIVADWSNTAGDVDALRKVMLLSVPEKG